MVATPKRKVTLSGVANNGVPLTEDGLRTDRPYRLDFVYPGAVLRMGQIMKEGLDKGRDGVSWAKVPIDIHLSHAMGHMLAYQSGDTSNDHLGHALCRIAFCVAQDDAGHRPMAVQAMMDAMYGLDEVQVSTGKPTTNKPKGKGRG